MQIVISITEELFKATVNGMNSDEIWDLRVAVKNGTPLPKGHERLIDEREVYKKFYCRCLAGVAKEVLDETSTIIEADRGDAE